MYEPNADRYDYPRLDKATDLGLGPLLSLSIIGAIVVAGLAQKCDLKAVDHSQPPVRHSLAQDSAACREGGGVPVVPADAPTGWTADDIKVECLRHPEAPKTNDGSPQN